MTFRYPSWIVAVVAGLALGGCASQPPGIPAPGGEAARPTPPGTFTIAQLAADPSLARPIQTPVAAATLMPSATLRGTNRRVSDDGQARLVSFEVAVADHTWVVHVPQLQQVQMTLDDQGNIVVARQIDFTQDALVLYDPAMLVIPAQVTTGARREGKVKMTIKSADGQSTRDSGTNAYVVRVLGKAKVATPAGVFDACLIQSTFKIDLGLADVDVTVLSAYAPDQGEVAEADVRKITALGLFTSTTHSQFERAR